MNPNYVHTITLYRNQNGAWQRTVLHNCFWKAQILSTQNGTEASYANTYTVRIPKEKVSDSFVVRPNDIVILGECKDEITKTSPNTAAEVLARHKPNAFKVTAYADNTSHFVDKHYRLGG